MRLAPLALVLATAATAHAAPPAWSKTAEGVHARLIVESATDAQKHAQIAVSVEIENVDDVGGGLALPWQDIGSMVSFTVEDSKGKPVEGMAPGGNHISPTPYIVMLPERSTLRASVTPAAIEYVPGGKILFRPIAFEAWELPAKHGPLFLRATLTPAKQSGKLPARAWSTPLALPAVALP
ncbi:MAG TPA: hypothetical protein VGM39_25535 [Kofleriaceae bacterium]|jgi:hypothetical protein